MKADAKNEAVLFIHSTGTGPSLWAGVPDAAMGGRQKLLPANVGYAPGELVERGRRVTAADDAAQVLRAISPDIARVHVVAHSYGALVALHAIPAIADRLVSVFFYEPVVFGAVARSPDPDPAALEELRRFVAPKGSVTLDGVSLTVNAVAGLELSVMLIPHTRQVTSLKHWRAGAELNLEADLVARYLVNYFEVTKQSPATSDDARFGLALERAGYK
jgi:pimeloyl-ACP methyl ester carboxylesterase